jgi:hypothetical protein
MKLRNFTYHYVANTLKYTVTVDTHLICMIVLLNYFSPPTPNNPPQNTACHNLRNGLLPNRRLDDLEPALEFDEDLKE